MKGQKVSMNSQSLDLFKKRKLYNKFAMLLSTVALTIALFFLGWILLTLILKGIGGINLTMFMESTPPPGSKGGLINAIVGSFLMMFFATLIGTPIGILAGTYLSEYQNDSILVQITKFLNDVLLSAPSIIIGLFVYSVYVAQVGHFSGWAGALALAIILLPVVVRTTDDMLKLVPNSLREAAFALGAPQWKVITLVSYKAAKAGIMTGILLAVARISGETAPLLMIGMVAFIADVPKNFLSSSTVMPVQIYLWAESAERGFVEKVSAGILIVLVFLVLMNLTAVLVRNKYERRW